MRRQLEGELFEQLVASQEQSEVDRYTARIRAMQELLLHLHDSALSPEYQLAVQRLAFYEKRRDLVNALSVQLELREAARPAALERLGRALHSLLGEARVSPEQALKRMRLVAEVERLDEAIALAEDESTQWFGTLVAAVQARGGGRMGEEDRMLLHKIRHALLAGTTLDVGLFKRLLGSIARRDFATDGVQFVLLKLRAFLRLAPADYQALLTEAGLPVPRDLIDEVIAAPFHTRFPSLREVLQGAEQQPEAVRAYQLVTSSSTAGGGGGALALTRA